MSPVLTPEFHRLRFEEGGKLRVADEMKDCRRSSGITFRRRAIHVLRHGKELFQRLRIPRAAARTVVS